MFTRWMVRTNKEGIDFGLWDIDPALLSLPLDVHSGRVARSLGLLKRKAKRLEIRTRIGPIYS